MPICAHASDTQVMELGALDHMDGGGERLDDTLFEMDESFSLRGHLEPALDRDDKSVIDDRTVIAAESCYDPFGAA